MSECVNTTLIPEAIQHAVHLGLSQNCQWLQEAMTSDNLTDAINWRDVLPPDVYNRSLAPCADNQPSQYAVWSADGYDGPPALNAAVGECKRGMCMMVIGSTGNPDITGVGVRTLPSSWVKDNINICIRNALKMISAYVFEICFVTLCYLAHASPCICNLVKHRTRYPPQPEKRTLYKPPGITLLSTALRMHATTMKRIMDTFLDAATFFALSITIASIVYISRLTSTYEHDMLLRVSILNSGGLYVVLSFSHDQLRRRRLRSSLVSLTSLLNCTLLLYSGTTRRTYAGWSYLCKDVYTFELPSLFAIPAMIYGTLEVVGIMAILHDWLCAKQLKRRKSKALRELKLSPYLYMTTDVAVFAALDRACAMILMCRRCTRGNSLSRSVYTQANSARDVWLVSTFSLAVSWTSAAAIIRSRHQSQNVAGDDYMENEFGYGQILALLIWLPVLLEYVYFAYCRRLPFAI